MFNQQIKSGDRDMKRFSKEWEEEKKKVLNKWGAKSIKIRFEIDKKEREIAELKKTQQKIIDKSMKECAPYLMVLAVSVPEDEEDDEED